MQPGFGAICELRDDIKHLRTDRRQRLTEGGKRGGIVVSGHMAGGYRLPKPGRKPGSFLKQRCNCRHKFPLPPPILEGPPPKAGCRRYAI